VRDFPKSAGYLALLTARGTTSCFSDPALLSREVKVRELKSTHFSKRPKLWAQGTLIVDILDCRVNLNFTYSCFRAKLTIF
jgi:hypothetical protein